MDLKLFICYLFLKIVTANISIDVNVDEKDNVTISFTGEEESLVTDDDLKLFELDTEKFKDGIAKHLKCHRPDEIYFRDSTKRSGLFPAKEYQVHKVLSVKSAKVTRISKRPVVVSSQDFENLTNETIKVNTGISHSIQNTLTVTWSMEKEFTVNREVSAGLNIYFFSVSGGLQYSSTTKWGVNVQKSYTETIGTTSGMEMNLKPGRAVRAVLSANAGYMDIEVIYKASLNNVIEIFYNKPCKSYYYYRAMLYAMMSDSGLSNEKTAVENIRLGYYVDASLKVYDKNTGLLL